MHPMVWPAHKLQPMLLQKGFGASQMAPVHIVCPQVGSDWGVDATATDPPTD